MKSLLTICIFLFLAIAAQSQTKTFVRIFDQEGKKIHKGYIENTSDSSLTISLNKETFEINADQISVIKMKRSFGHTILITSLIAGASMAIIGAATADPDAWIFAYTAAEGAFGGLMIGAATGVATGSIIAGTRNRPVFNIDRKHEQWIKVKDLLRQRYPIPGNQASNTIMNQTR